MRFHNQNWEQIIIGDVFETASGGTPLRSRPEFFNGHIPWLKSGEITQGIVLTSEEKITELGLKKSSAKLFPPETVLVAMYGVTAGEVGLLKIYAATNQAICGILPSEKIIPYFLYTLLKSRRDYFLQRSVGTAQPNISMATIRNTEISLPPLEEQKQLVELFQTIDQAIDQVENQQSQLLQLRHGLCDGLIFGQPYFGDMLSNESCLPLLLEAFADSIEEHDKAKTDITRFVGLENIEPGEFIIKSWGNIEDGTTFTKRFRVGDVLFGKRRAYLKKVAVATFDGICSSDILVLRAKPEKILPGLLPFYISADPFIEYAVTTSAGSLSPRTKWKDLAKFEISLPDLKTQEKILSVLQGIETTRLQLANQKANLKKLKQQLLNEILG